MARQSKEKPMAESKTWVGGSLHGATPPRRTRRGRETSLRLKRRAAQRSILPLSPLGPDRPLGCTAPETGAPMRSRLVDAAGGWGCSCPWTRAVLAVAAVVCSAWFGMNGRASSGSPVLAPMDVRGLARTTPLVLQWQPCHWWCGDKFCFFIQRCFSLDFN